MCMNVCMDICMDMCIDMCVDMRTGTPEFAFGSGLSYSRWSLNATSTRNSLDAAAGSVRANMCVISVYMCV